MGEMSAPNDFLRRFISHSVSSRRSARARPQGRPRSQRARAHAEARAKRRRHVAQGIAAAGAAAFVAECPGRVGAQPVASCFALRINALHGEAGQKLHIVSLSGRSALCGAAYRETRTPLEWTDVGADCGANPPWCQEERPQYIGVRLQRELAEYDDRGGVRGWKSHRRQSWRT